MQTGKLFVKFVVVGLEVNSSAMTHSSATSLFCGTALTGNKEKVIQKLKETHSVVM